MSLVFECGQLEVFTLTLILAVFILLHWKIQNTLLNTVSFVCRMINRLWQSVRRWVWHHGSWWAARARGTACHGRWSLLAERTVNWCYRWDFTRAQHTHKLCVWPFVFKVLILCLYEGGRGQKIIHLVTLCRLAADMPLKDSQLLHSKIQSNGSISRNINWIHWKILLVERCYCQIEPLNSNRLTFCCLFTLSFLCMH